MTSTGDALFAAVLADPTDQDARTVYADWLEENGLPETAAWWRGEEAAHLFTWMEYWLRLGPRRVIGGIVLDYQPGGMPTA
jgi:uncharacterized protein (TIGR02996 family)